MTLQDLINLLPTLEYDIDLYVCDIEGKGFTIDSAEFSNHSDNGTSLTITVNNE